MIGLPKGYKLARDFYEERWRWETGKGQQFRCGKWHPNPERAVLAAQVDAGDRRSYSADFLVGGVFGAVIVVVLVLLSMCGMAL